MVVYFTLKVLYMMRPEDRRALFVKLHRSIAESADAALAIVESRGALVYPPGAELSDAETVALSNLRLSEHARAALRKLLVDVASRPLFDFFALADGVADPAPRKHSDPWLGLSITARDSDDDERDDMWHDDFFESYWTYKDGSPS